MTQSSAVHCYSVFIVEDETLLRLMISEMLEELGHHVSSEAGQIEQALPLAKTAEFDVALLDVNVAGRLITPVAEIVASRNRRWSSSQAMDATESPSRSVTGPRFGNRSCFKIFSKPSITRWLHWPEAC
jgi:DNA-binding NtrC family response regulator